MTETRVRDTAREQEPSRHAAPAFAASRIKQTWARFRARVRRQTSILCSYYSLLFHVRSAANHRPAGITLAYSI